MATARRGQSAKSPLQVITELAGLLAAAAAVVYGTGGVVLALRLAFEHLPWSNIVSGLPREFVISTGAGQVLLPSLAVAALYGLYRALRRDRPRPPARRFFDDGDARWKVVLRYLLTFVLLLVPLLFVQLVRGTSVFEGIDPWLLIGLGSLLVILAVAVQEGRAVAMTRLGATRRWNGGRAIATMAGLYALAAMPAMMLAAAATPLTSVKVCTSAGGEVSGKLVGESSDRVYLGEAATTPEKVENRRIVVLPMANVEQIFVGPHPTGAICEAR